MNGALHLHCWLLVLLLLLCNSSGAEPKEKVAGYKSVIKATAGDSTAEWETLFHGDFAVAISDGEPETVYNLKEMWWHDLETGTRRSFEQSKRWHAASLEKTRKGLATEVDEKKRRFVGMMIDPRFAVEEKDGGLVMKNEALEYVMRPLAKVPDDFEPRLSAYNVLNAYQTAFMDRNAPPPDSALKVGEELARRKVYARQTMLTINNMAGKHTLKVSMELVPLTQAEAGVVSETVAGLKTSDYKLSVRVKVRDKLIQADVLFHGDHVVTITDKKLEAIFNLKDMWWHHLESRQRMTLEESKKSHAIGNERIRRSLDSAPEAQRRFFGSLLDPRFKIEEKDGELVMSNDSLQYKMQVAKLPEELAPKLAAYNELNAYETSIVEDQLPPDPALAIAKELAKRKVYAKKTLATIKTPQEVLDLDVTMNLVDLTEDEAKLVTETIARFKQ